MLPENIRKALITGKEKLCREKCVKDPNEKLKRWVRLCAEAQIDLGPLAPNTDWKMPQDLGFKHWFHINVPGLNIIVAEYICKSGVWQLEKWGVARDERFQNKTIRVWMCYQAFEKEVDYIIAVARENFVHRMRINNKIIRVSEVKIEDVSEAV